MRLLRLRLQDFRSYRQADIDFSSVRLASVVGSNGAGKSSLLEATIFALTGARGIRNLDAFVRQGCEECRVALVFRAAGETFRVTRTRSTRGSGKSTVELARQDTGGLWVAEGAGARDTEERIRQILGVDEETLLGTAIVSQGDAGSFFALRPAQRLEALGSILRLNERFGPLEAHFRARAAEARADLEAARRDMERLEQDVEALAAKEAARLQAEEQLDQARAAVARAEKELDQAQHAASLTQAAVGSLGLARAKRDELRRRRNDLEDRRRQLAAEADSLLARIAERAALESELARKDDLERARELELQCREADQAGEAERRRLEQALTTARERLREAAEEYRRAAGRAEEAREEFMAACGAQDAVSAAALDIEERIREIEAADQPICDRCGQPIADAALVTTLDSLREELDVAEQRVEQTKERVEQTKERLREAKEAVTAATAHGQDRRREVEAAEGELAALPEPGHSPARLAALDAKLARLAEIPAQLAIIATLEERLAVVHSEAESVALALAAPDLVQTLAAAEEAVSAAETSAREADEARARVELLQAILDGERGRLSQADRLAARLEGEVATLSPSRARLEEARRQAKVLEQAQADAELLRKAMSKWGVPALIVQSVLLALEKEVNELLAIYEGSLALRFESERETRDGARDSLEILVHDGENWRPFETYSGGERYRVASAMRLGLAKLLAHRSGARVETLIVDEPEGLDADGRAHLARILEHMSADFGITLLLTHYEDLKDAMPQQLVVSRGEDGLSRVEVMAA